jgi:hypothetical protein
MCSPPTIALFVSLVVMSLFSGCADGTEVIDEVPDPFEPTYEHVEFVIRRSCSFSSSCHGGRGRGEARLNFAAVTNVGEPVTDLLNGVLSCEYDRMPRIDPGNPDNSWLWIKLTAETDDEGFILFEPDDDWEHGLEEDEDGLLERSTCPLTEEGVLSFGLSMPRNLEEPAPLADEEIEMIRQWIVLGAPGPD